MRFGQDINLYYYQPHMIYEMDLFIIYLLVADAVHQKLMILTHVDVVLQPLNLMTVVEHVLMLVGPIDLVVFPNQPRVQHEDFVGYGLLS